MKQHAIQTSSLNSDTQNFPLLALDSTKGSLVHWLFNRLSHHPKNTLSPLAIYAITLALTLLPLLIGAAVSPHSLFYPDDTLRLPLLRDWNTLFMLLCSFPCLVMLIANDQNEVTSALKTVQRNGTLTISNAAATELCMRWRQYFRQINLIGQIVGFVVGSVFCYYGNLGYSDPSVGFWIVYKGSLLPLGFIYLYILFLFYAVIPIYIFRSIGITLLFKDIVSQAEFRLIPLHPDKSGGLRLVGYLGLRNQYALTILGINIVLLFVTTHYYLNAPSLMYTLIGVVVVMYIALGPIAFIMPLLPFRTGMLKTKSNLMMEVSTRLDLEISHIRKKLLSSSITQEDEELIDRLRKIGAVIEELPTWPFDATTLRKFFVAYITPVASALLLSISKEIFNHIFKYTTT